MAPGLGRLKPDTTGSSHRGRPASDFSTFPFISNIIYIPSLGVKVQSDAHYSRKKIVSLICRLYYGAHNIDDSSLHPFCELVILLQN